MVRHSDSHSRGRGMSTRRSLVPSSCRSMYVIQSPPSASGSHMPSSMSRMSASRIGFAFVALSRSFCVARSMCRAAASHAPQRMSGRSAFTAGSFLSLPRPNCRPPSISAIMSSSGPADAPRGSRAPHRNTDSSSASGSSSGVGIALRPAFAGAAARSAGWPCARGFDGVMVAHLRVAEGTRPRGGNEAARARARAKQPACSGMREPCADGFACLVGFSSFLQTVSSVRW
mmetsp:Transcript_15606/g.46030  ORF Transcript_15606/g.46030 Transcript_15606/m.46030 type:complete len:230 (+) Transcript_15606:767-1456(+)